MTTKLMPSVSSGRSRSAPRLEFTSVPTRPRPGRPRDHGDGLEQRARGQTTAPTRPSTISEKYWPGRIEGHPVMGGKGGDHQRAHAAGEERAQRGRGQRRARRALRAPSGSRRSRPPRTTRPVVHQDGGGRAAVLRAIDAGQHDQGRRRLERNTSGQNIAQWWPLAQRPSSTPIKVPRQPRKAYNRFPRRTRPEAPKSGCSSGFQLRFLVMVVAPAQPVMKVGHTGNWQVQRHDEGQVAAHGGARCGTSTPLS